ERIDEAACEVVDLFRANPRAILQDVIGDEGETLVVKSSRLTIDIPPRLVLFKHRHKPIKRTDPRAERNKIGLAAPPGRSHFQALRPQLGSPPGAPTSVAQRNTPIGR